MLRDLGADRTLTWFTAERIRSERNRPFSLSGDASYSLLDNKGGQESA